ncbi:MAG TPA: HU family DNA-binding protein [Abditibacteriaceae bacterium]|nr:HU family DNA-binding protein [Abditibacteriaceae bacterium]
MAATANKGGRAAASSRSDLVEKIADQCGLTQAKAEEVTRAYEDAIKQALAGGGEVRLAGFGTFKVTHRAARPGRNPATGAPLQIAAQTSPRFTPGKQFKEQIGGSTGGSKGSAKGGAKAGAAKGGASKAGASKSGAAKAGAAKAGASKGGAKAGAAKGGGKAGASKGGRK